LATADAPLHPVYIIDAAALFVIPAEAGIQAFSFTAVALESPPARGRRGVATADAPVHPVYIIDAAALFVIPAEPGIQAFNFTAVALDPRLRGDDGGWRG